MARPGVIGQPIFAHDTVTLDGTTIAFPRPLPGVAEYVAVANAEAEETSCVGSGSMNSSRYAMA